MGLPVIGQFDPAFTAIMDDVMALARQVFVTRNDRCFAVSGLASAGREAVLNSLVEDGDAVAVGGGPRFVVEAAEIARRYGARVIPLDEIRTSATALVLVPHVDPELGTGVAVDQLADFCHQHGARLIVDATWSLGGRELRVDAWGIDVCIAGVDHALGAPSGMALVTYSADVEARLAARRAPPRTSYLDLVQLQAYWSPERLNHHTAPTSLVYGLREALRLVAVEGLERRWERHRQVGLALRDGLDRLGLRSGGEPPYVILTDIPNEVVKRADLLDRFGVYVTHIGGGTWRIALLGADARPEAVEQVLAALEKVLA
jgi:(S)-ureidoglycine-glyoxylate aminotransferase